MSVGELFSAHLRGPERNVRGLQSALEGLGFANEAAAYGAWCAHDHEIVGQGAWFGRRIAIGAVPPTAVDGELWFDICELALMIRAGRAWLSTRATRQWQMRGFLDVAQCEARAVQVAPPYLALDPERLLGVEERAICTRLTCGEASLYSWWFGKGLPHLFDWQAAQESLGSAMRDLWMMSRKEWTSTKLDEDEAARIFVTPSTIDWDPDEVLESELGIPETKRGMVRGEFTREPDIGFRTAVSIESGLFEAVTYWGSLAENLKLTSLLNRRAFR